MNWRKDTEEMTREEVVDTIAEIAGIDDDEYYCGQHFQMNKPALVKILETLQEKEGGSSA